MVALGGAAVFGVGLNERTALVIQGAAASVHGPAVRGVYFYEHPGSAEMFPGVALTMDVMRRLRIAAGGSVAWPPDFGSAGTDEIAVREGVVGNL
ncbi:MAG: hypothetical protein J4G12_01090 [Gemmatimonadetes bacterium]|nr:hypothetical protein [Gemmatimonadota bacterium]